MYRVTSQILSHKYILYRRSTVPHPQQAKAVSSSPSLFKYKKATERDTCPKPLPPPPPPPKDDRVFWGTLSLLVMASGFAYFARQSPEVRDWLTLHAPWFDDIIAIAGQENMTYREFAEQCVEDIKKYIKDCFDDNKPKPCSHDESIAADPDSEIVYCEDEDEEDNNADEEGEGSEKRKCKKLTPPVITKNICEVEECLRDLGETVVVNFISARDACAVYNAFVQEAMRDFSMCSLNKIHAAMADRDQILKESSENICNASQKMDSLAKYLECGVQAPKQSMDEVRGLIADFQDKISAARMQYQWENDKSVALDTHVIKVEEMMLKYTDENQTLFTGLKYDQKKPTLNGDADLLLYHAFRYATRLSTELCEASTGMTERVNRALATLPQTEKELKARKYAIDAEYRKKKYELDKEYQKRYDDQRVKNDNILKEALQKQKERHEEILEKKLLQKEKETTAKLDKLVAEKVASEKKQFAILLTEMAAKLKIVEDKLEARLKAERETRRSQQLYAAGASLLAATKKGDPVVKVNKELNAIEKASGDDDKLVKTVLKAIPDSVRTVGLVPESVLRERYHRMEKAALRVALVEQDGGPLPIYILSWLQSMVLFMKLSCIPQSEIDKPPKEPAQDLDTFDLLRRARFWIERGNLAAALRYVSSLEGASRLAASTWFDAARSHLETRQAAEAVLAHAAALGLQYI